MAEQARTQAELLALFADNEARNILEEYIRNLVLSVVPGVASCYISTAAATTIPGTTAYYKVNAAAWTSRKLHNWTAANGRLTYTGIPDVHIHVAGSISMTAAANNQILHFRVVKNDDYTDPDSVASDVDRKVGTGADVGSTAIHYDSMMSTGDYIEIWVRNETSASNMTMTKEYFFALAMMDAP